jgi:hypothetical protein
MKIKLTVIGVILFIIALIFSLFAEKSKADPYIGLGYTVANSELPTGEFSYRFSEKWDASIQAIGAGATEKGDQDQVGIVSASRIVDPDWHLWKSKFFMRIGLAYVTDTPLVGHGNFRLGAGFDMGVWELEYMHYSSAGINDTNRGIDAIGIRVKL